MKQKDYSEAGYYFVTICVKNRECVFGSVCDVTMKRNVWGQIAHDCWEEIPNHFPDVEIDEFIVMPNHVHGIVVIKNDENKGRDKACLVPTNRRHVMKLSSIIGSYKSAVTKRIGEISELHFQWQRSFHDHIIRNEEELLQIQQYIIFNPSGWHKDKFFVESNQ